MNQLNEAEEIRLRKNLYEVFLAKKEQLGDHAFLRRRAEGEWRDVSWNQLSAMIDDISLALLKLGVKKGEAVCLLSENSVEWIAADLAITSIGAVTAAIYASSTPAECAYIINHSEARVIFTEDCEQHGKIRERQEELPELEYVVVFSPTGRSRPPKTWSLKEFLRYGQEAGEAGAQELRRRRAEVVQDDALTYIYTSGTTGPPKGVILTHGNALYICDCYAEMGFVRRGDNSLSILPLAHALERMIFYISMSLGGVINISDDIYNTAQYLLEVKPSILICVPRVLEKAYNRVVSRADEASAAQKKLFAWSVETGKAAAKLRYGKKKIPVMLKIKCAAADALVFRRIRRGLGGKLRFIGSGGAPLSAAIVEFFCAVGIPVVQGWGMTETSAPATQMPLDAIRYDSVGKAIKGVEIKTTGAGELIVRGPGIFKGYLKQPEDTAATIVDGWCHTGDLGSIDEDGYVKITGRMKELIITAGGKNISPLNIEFTLVSGSIINQAVVIGDSRPYLSALITLKDEELRAWAKENGVEHEPGQQLETHPEVREHVAAVIDEKNKLLPRYMTVKKFKIIPGEFSHENGELTPTLKTKRAVIFKKYEKYIEEMYKD